MQIVITLESVEELNQFMENMKITSVNAKQNTAKAEKNAAKAEQKEAKAEQKAEETSAPVMPAPAPTPAPEPVTVRAVTRQEVQAKAIAQMDAGKKDQLQALLKKYNVPALPSIPDVQLAAFYADLEVL